MHTAHYELEPPQTGTIGLDKGFMRSTFYLLYFSSFVFSANVAQSGLHQQIKGCCRLFVDVVQIEPQCTTYFSLLVQNAVNWG